MVLVGFHFPLEEESRKTEHFRYKVKLNSKKCLSSSDDDDGVIIVLPHSHSAAGPGFNKLQEWDGEQSTVCSNIL